MIGPVKTQTAQNMCGLMGAGWAFCRVGVAFVCGCGIFLLFDDDFIGKWAARSAFFYDGSKFHGKTAKQRRRRQTVEALARPVVEGMGLQRRGSRFEKEGPDWFLRILIDRDEPLDTDTCEAVSRAIDPLLDEADPIEQSYYLEVGGPGLGRRLTRRALRGTQGSEVRCHLIRPDEGRPPRHRGASCRGWMPTATQLW